MSRPLIYRSAVAISVAGALLAIASGVGGRDAGAGVDAAAGRPLPPPSINTTEPTSVDASQPQSTADLLRNAAAARRSHDGRALAMFRVQLTKLVGAPAIHAATAAYEKTLANLRAAILWRDGRAGASFRAQLAALCGDTSLASAFEDCGPALEGR